MKASEMSKPLYCAPKTIWREVLRSEEHRNPGFEKSWAVGGSIRLFLVCGHEVSRKLSQGVPRRTRCRDCERVRASRSKRAVNGHRITADRIQAHRLARREARDLVRRLRATHECPRCGHRYDGPHPERHVAVAGVECPGGHLGEIRRLPRP